MKREEIIYRIKKERILAIIRLSSQDEVSPLLKTLTNNGIHVLEITSNTPGYAKEIELARKEYPECLIGAGTVLNPSIANRAIEAGAQFLVTPNVNLRVIETAHKHNIPVLMGAMTPTEIYTAVEHGADFIKLFPAGNLGIDYFKSIKAVMDDVNFIAVGGIDASNMQEWLNAGVRGVGLGSALTNIKGNSTEIIHAISQFIQISKSN